MSIERLRKILFNLLVISLPAGGVIIPLGRSWTPMQLIILVLTFIYILKLIKGNFNLLISKGFIIYYCLFFGISVISIVFMPDKPRYINDKDSSLVSFGVISLMYLVWQIFNLLTVFFVYNEIKQKGKLFAIFRLFLNSSVFYAFYGFYQVLTVMAFGDRAQAITYALKPEYLWGPEAIRLASLSREPLYYSFYLSFVLITSLIILSDKTLLKQVNLKRTRLLFITVINIIAFILSKPTAGFFSLVIALFFYAFISTKFSTRVSLKKVFNRLSIGIVFTGCFLGYLASNYRGIVSRLTRVSDVDSGYMRIVSYVEAVNNILKDPFTGYGIGNSSFFISVGVLGNSFLSVTAEIGVFGLVCYLLIWLLIWKKSNKVKLSNTDLRPLGLIYMLYLVAAFVQFNSFHGYNLSFFWFISGLILVTSKLSGNGES